MTPSPLRSALWKKVILWTAFILGCCLASSLILMADTPPARTSAAVSTCYCHCAGSTMHQGCVKLCELPKYASHPWAVTCAKPHEKIRIVSPDAGPRYEHPGRNERAGTAKPSPAS